MGSEALSCAKGCPPLGEVRALLGEESAPDLLRGGLAPKRQARASTVEHLLVCVECELVVCRRTLSSLDEEDELRC
eukprot:5564114-Pyramimonas_sp.AAC.1